jgi:hypothetical protein
VASSLVLVSFWWFQEMFLCFFSGFNRMTVGGDQKKNNWSSQYHQKRKLFSLPQKCQKVSWNSFIPFLPVSQSDPGRYPLLGSINNHSVRNPTPIQLKVLEFNGILHVSPNQIHNFPTEFH